ncbi:MAG: glutamate--tRNA ligase [bacterium]|nr:MAG: glutamate--tRNA ligase [bacterium]
MTQVVIVKTRFAPSPTGSLHLGGARTALFNWLFARSKNGEFVLRIEDTDKERSKPEYVEEIIESLKWLGLDWDGEPYFQSQKTALYQEKIETLLSEDKAYRCYCTKEVLDTKRSEMMKAGEKPMYDRTCRDLEGQESSRPHVVRFKTPLTGAASFVDTLRGVVEVGNDELDDLIIRRTDGSVTYNLVVVVDDAEMGITSVIRGDDHIANTPKQVNLYKGLGYEPPEFTHVSMILGKDKKRLSKRHGAESLLEYRDEGYLPAALVNMLARLGWGYGDQELFTREELVEKFTLSKITMSPAVFDKEKLDWLNAQHIKTMDNNELARLALPFVQKRHPHATQEDAEKLIPLLKERSRTLVEMAEGMDFYFTREIRYEQKAEKKFLTEKGLKPLERVMELIENCSDLDTETLDREFRKLAENLGLKLKEIAQPVRVALTGKTVSPGVFEMINVLGRRESLNRLKAASDIMRSIESTVK